MPVAVSISMLKRANLMLAGIARGVTPNGRLKPDARLSCFSGGWVMSARQMARFMRTLRHTNAIVNRTTYGNMTACRLGF